MPLSLSTPFAQAVWKWLVVFLGGVRLAWLRQGLHWISVHTGVPAIVVAAVLVVVLYRLAKRSARFAVQVSVVLVLLAALVKLGVLRF